MRKVFSVLVLAALVSGAVWAQPTEPAPSAAASLKTLKDYLKNNPFQAAPTSPVNAVSGRFSTDVDNYLGVTDWNGVAENFANTYFFLGGDGTAAGGGIMGGFAKKLGSAYLAFYIDGNLFKDGYGYNSGSDDSDTNTTGGSLLWNNWFGFLFGNEAIGGIRFDLQLGNGTNANAAWDTSTGGGKVKESDNLGPVTTTLQWGKALGAITPNVGLGFRWPGTHIVNNDGTKNENYKNAALWFHLGVDIGDFGVENNLTIDFGTTNNNDGKKSTESGYVLDGLGVYYAITADITEKIQFKAKPRIDFTIAGKDNKKTPVQGDAYNDTAPQFWFALSPSSQLALKFQANEKLAFYTGVNLTLLTFTVEADSSYKGQGGAEVKDKPSKWTLEGIQFANLNINSGSDLEIAATFAFSPAFSLEANISSPLLNIAIPGSEGSQVGNPFAAASWLNTKGSLLVNFKPGAGAAE
ncbi:MAG: hypothetical protein LBG72_05435 [Spirochaetaceae bacterium]|jgi:hypothetical protein|nr:hypothetical protein [Spirochaetaceae bacterium]